ncbi:MAG: DEAD/DEAH box helicase family protein [Lentisphaerota bacterium]
MIQLKEYQIKAVDELLDKSLTLLSCDGRQQKLIFKAPTGSGKTVMTGAWLQKLARTLPGQLELAQRQFAYIWIAPNQLHQQSLQKLTHYFEETRDLRCLEFDDLADEALAENDLLFFNWQSISRDDAIVIRESELGRNLSNLVEKTRAAGIEIIAILDEAHLFATKGDKALKVLNMINAKLEIDVSATPILHSDDIVVIKRDAVVKAEMIKKGVVLNPALKDHGLGDTLNAYLLKSALSKRGDLAKRYEKMGSPVRPLLLIQLPNDKATLSEEDRELREMIEKYLETQQITTANGKLAVWLSDNKDKINLENIEKHDSLVEVLLFKQAIALGWDCPRASVLLIFRDLKAITFTIQTVGRILRMPEHRHYSDDLLNYGYVYTNLAKDVIMIVRDDMDYFQELRAVRRETYQNLGLQSCFINKRLVRNRLSSKFHIALEIAAKKTGWISPEENMKCVEKNLKMLESEMCDINPQKISIKIPKDFRFDGDHEQAVQGDTLRYARTAAELDHLLHHFCLNSCGDYAKVDSAPILKLALLEFFEAYLGLDEFDATKFILAENNQFLLSALTRSALSEYEQILKEHAATVSRNPAVEPWEVPEERHYNAEQYAETPRPAHVMQPAYAQRQESSPEKRFAELLESNSQCLEWWYKNGDHGKEHFAVPYRNASGEWALFYVDFLIKFKDGTLGLFDTKMQRGDAEAFRKHNALLEYINSLRTLRPSEKFAGGIIIADGNSWKHCREKLSGGFDLAGWDNFNPKDYAG